MVISMTDTEIRRIVEDTENMFGVKKSKTYAPSPQNQGCCSGAGDKVKIPADLFKRLEQLLREIMESETKKCGGCCKEKKPEKQSGAEAWSELLLEEDIVTLHKQGKSALTIGEDCIVTPLAYDKARELGVKLIKE